MQFVDLLFLMSLNGVDNLLDVRLNLWQDLLMDLGYSLGGLSQFLVLKLQYVLFVSCNFLTVMQDFVEFVRIWFGKRNFLFDGLCSELFSCLMSRFDRVNQLLSLFFLDGCLSLNYFIEFVTGKLVFFEVFYSKLFCFVELALNLLKSGKVKLSVL